MAYPLQDLLKVRKIREDKANNEVVKARYRVQEAEQEVVKRKQELKEYHQWRINKENELFDEIIDKVVKKADLDELKAKIAKLRADELNYEQRIEEAKKAVVEAKKALEAAIQAYKAAVRDREKIDEHKNIWVEEWQKEQNALEEKEMEDFRVRELEHDYEGEVVNYE